MDSTLGHRVDRVPSNTSSWRVVYSFHMESDSRQNAPAPQNYIAEYRAALDRVESLGLKAPKRHLARQDCLNPDLTLKLALKYFDSHTPEELMLRPLHINADFIALLWNNAHVPLEITLGVVDIAGKRYGECSEETIRRYLRDKEIAWQRDGVPFRVWLTSPACEVLDVTFAMVTSRTRDQCAKRIFYKPASVSHFQSPTYHPMLVGEDFLYQTGALFDLDDDQAS